MSDQKVTALTELTTPDSDDIAYIVDDPGGTPISKKMKLKYFRGCLHYLALISQTGNAAPVATVWDNTLGTVTWTRTAEGEFHATSSALFTANKTYTARVFHVNTQDSIGGVAVWESTSSILFLVTDVLGVGQDSELVNVLVRIEVYL